MPGNGQNTQMAAAYPTNEQYERWKVRADEFDMTVSGFISSMVEAGLKKFDLAVEPDHSNLELRGQRDDLKAELDRKRDRIKRLEEQLYNSDSFEILRYIDENPGPLAPEVIDHLKATAPERANAHLEVLEGETLDVENGRYYLKDETGGMREVTYADVRR